MAVTCTLMTGSPACSVAVEKVCCYPQNTCSGNTVPQHCVLKGPLTMWFGALVLCTDALAVEGISVITFHVPL